MATANHRTRRLERAIDRALDTRRPVALRCVAAIAHDYNLHATEARAAAAERFLGGRRHG